MIVVIITMKVLTSRDEVVIFFFLSW
jgi:hypothetical protein